MKKSILLIAIVAICNIANATVITVSNNTSSPGQYYNLQTAVYAAKSGDTIYVSGSPYTYGNISINKPLTLLGTGYSPNKAEPLVSQMGNLTLTDTLNASNVVLNNSSGSIIKGLIINQISASDQGGITASAINNIIISRNQVGSISTNNSQPNQYWLIENNIIDGNISSSYGYGFLTNNVIITNNIIYDGTISFGTGSGLLISNNIFQGSYAAFNTLNAATIANNIFYISSPYSSSVTNCVFNNNITYETASNTIPYGSNTGTGNIIGTDPQFVSITVPNNFSFSNNYQLKSTSPCLKAGDDGTDLGIFGGGVPNVDLTGSPNIPQIKSFNIKNSVVNLNSPLNIDFKGKIQN